MSQSRTNLQAFVDEQVRKIKGIYFPVRVSWLKRFLTRKLPCASLYPNPYDEFSLPEIGPSAEVISHYEKLYREARGDLSELAFQRSPAAEPLIVQKLSPDGYMILNGHHRWIAAMRAGIRKMPVQIVNLTQENDVRRMLERSGGAMRAVFDLDEVVFREGARSGAPRRRAGAGIPADWVRREIPALFSQLEEQGYDIWVYAAGYDSADDIERLFRRLRVPVRGVVTGMARKAARSADMRAELRKLLETRYRSATHIDRKMILRTTAGSKDVESRALSGDERRWPEEVLEVIGEMDRHE